MAKDVSTFLMFQGQAEEALTFYTSLFPGSSLENVQREGTKLSRATLRLAGQDFMVFDSPVKHAFTFTPAISLFVTCESDAEIEKLAAALAEGGGVMMPLGAYGFSKRFAWVADRFGVSWQLNLPT